MNFFDFLGVITGWSDFTHEETDEEMRERFVDETNPWIQNDDGTWDRQYPEVAYNPFGGEQK